MIVADASAITELLLVGPRAKSIRGALAEHAELHVPEHFHVEVLSALRRYSIRRELSELRASEALSALAELRTLSYPVIELVDAVWALHETLTAYDAAYLALAQRLDVGLITLDGGLARAAAADGRLVKLTG
ncbi:MAG TPA: type II toxin-antitoxin system VapC family toxin [Solirubrobacteraceae bacterium]|nr:type II toxin-antitoxin system VapC family toxin [Solirubrobacteraceae bacterium]